jgi:hypothetical protein
MDHCNHVLAHLKIVALHKCMYKIDDEFDWQKHVQEVLDRHTPCRLYLKITKRTKLTNLCVALACNMRFGGRVNWSKKVLDRKKPFCFFYYLHCLVLVGHGLQLQ